MPEACWPTTNGTPDPGLSGALGGDVTMVPAPAHLPQLMVLPSTSEALPVSSSVPASVPENPLQQVKLVGVKPENVALFEPPPELIVKVFEMDGEAFVNAI